MEKEDTADILDIFFIYERFYKISGVWPLKRKYIKSGIYIVYCVINTIMEYVNMILVFEDFNTLVENLLETLVVSVTFVMILVVRFHPSLVGLIATIKNDIANTDYRSNEERSLYNGYNRIAYNITKIALPLAITTVAAMYIKPLSNILRALLKSGNNDTRVDPELLILPFNGMQFVHVTDLRIFFVLYIFRLPCIYIASFHTLTICFILGLILHICGKLAVIRQRVKMFETTSKDQLDATIRRHVQSHLRLIDTLKLIEDIFQYVLLLDLIQTSVRLGFTSYVALTSKDAGSEFTKMCIFLSYTSILFLLLYVYCLVGEYLIQESKDLAEAYYQCNWQEMPTGCKTSLMICMICSQRYLTFTAGKFYQFTLYGYTDIIKTSMGYVSLLRTIG